VCCSLTDEEIESNVIVMLFAGHDTSSATLALALAQLTDNPRVMQRLREEQQQVVAAHGSSLDATALRSMPYAEAVIRWVGGWVRGCAEASSGDGWAGWQQ
jgi:cytochrome P450